MKSKEVVIAAILAVILFVQQIALSYIPNVHITALLIILYSIYFKKLTLPAIFTFILLEGIFYGFGIWWFNYLYIWPIFALICINFNKITSIWFWSFIALGNGLSFGALCSIPYFFIGGISMGFSYFITGIPFDIVHGISNFLVCITLYKPLSSVFLRLENMYYNKG